MLKTFLAPVLAVFVFASAALAQPSPTQVLKTYFRLINTHNYAGAFKQWDLGDNHANSAGQTAASFAKGFADTASVTAAIGKEGAPDGAAGSVYVDVPVTLKALGKSGKISQFNGTYTLRRSTVDGGDPNWKITTAKMKAVN